MKQRSNMEEKETELFGGSFKCVLPATAHDMSKFREVPDNQEVFCHESSDQSIMFDLLEYQSQVQGQDAVRYHFHDLAECNDATAENEVKEIETIPSSSIIMNECSEAWFLLGHQKVSKFNEGEVAKNVVEIYMVLYRMPTFGTDMVMIMNNPVVLSSSSSSNVSSHSLWTPELFKKSACTLKLVDPSVFLTG